MKKINETFKQGFLKVLLFTLVFIGVFACDNDDKKASDTKTFVLVNGSWQGSFVWDEVKEQLEKQGHQVITVELQAHGADQSPLTEATLVNYVARVKTAINGVEGKVILVGHSLGGAIVTQSAAQLPDKIEKLVYIAGFIPQNGKSVFELSAQDNASEIMPSVLQFSEDMTSVTFADPEVNIPNIFCHDGSQQQKALLVSKLRFEPLAPLGTPLQYDPSIFASLDKYYIYTTEDRAISYKFQQQMAQQAGIIKTFSIVASHSPFLSKPTEVYSILENLTH
jgi:pimeloyl-ACP methyl ester carboxylesterase